MSYIQLDNYQQSHHHEHEQQVVLPPQFTRRQRSEVSMYSILCWCIVIALLAVILYYCVLINKRLIKITEPI